VTAVPRERHFFGKIGKVFQVNYRFHELTQTTFVRRSRAGRWSGLRTRAHGSMKRERRMAQKIVRYAQDDGLRA